MTATAYQALLHHTDLAGVYQLPQGARANVIAAAEANGYTVFPVNLRKANDKTSLLRAIAQHLAFPEWFGHNYDALYDCLCDPAWPTANGYLILFDHCPGIDTQAEAEFSTLLDIAGQASEAWRQRGIALWCLVDQETAGIACLPTVTSGP